MTIGAGVEYQCAVTRNSAPLNDFLDNYERSLAAELGLVIVKSGKSGVTMEMQLDERHLNFGGAVQGGVPMMMADIAGALGAIHNLDPGYVTTTLESKTNFLGRGAGNVLWAESEPVHIGRTTSVWRTQIWRGFSPSSRARICEVTQTQLNLPASSEGGPARKAAVVAGRSEEPAAQGTSEASEIIQLADVRRLEILRGAIKVISEKGFAKASVREISDAAGMPIPTMYKYISSKDEILELLYQNIMREFNEHFQSLLDMPASPAEKLSGALSANIQAFGKYRNELKLLFTESKALSPEARHRIYALDRQYIMQWTGLIEGAGMDRRLGVDAELLANFIYYLTTIWVIRHWAIGKWGIEDVTRAMTALITSRSEPGDR